MASRGSAVHVVTTTRHYKGRVYTSHLLRRSYRDGGKVRNETLGNLSHLPEDVIELIRRALRGETLIPAEAVFQILRSRPHGHVAAVLGTLKKLGLDRILASRSSLERDRCVALIAARVLAPGSKLATARTLNQQSATSTLAEMLHLDQLNADDLYAAMDWLLQRQPKIGRALAKRHLSNGALVLYDVSSSYLTGRHFRLARIGHSRDGKKGSPQIVYGLLCNAAGCCIKEVLGEMRQRRSGCIINVTSVAGKIACSPLTPYAASKFALEALSEGLAQEMKPHNVRVAIVEPGIIDTPMARRIEKTPDESIYPQAHRFSRMFFAVLRQPVEPLIVANKMVEIAESDDWKLRHPVGPDAEPFLGWRAAMNDEQWVDWGAKGDQEWYEAVEADFGIDARP